VSTLTSDWCAREIASRTQIPFRFTMPIGCFAIAQDVIEALKAHYRREGLQQQFNVPSVVRVMDSLGHVAHLVSDRLNPAMLDYSTEAAAQLRCGDTLSIEVTVDPSFDAEFSGGRQRSSSKSRIKAGPLNNKGVLERRLPPMGFCGRTAQRGDGPTAERHHNAQSNAGPNLECEVIGDELLLSSKAC
jgi:hypothetical protein